MIHPLSPCPLSLSVLWAPSNCFFFQTPTAILCYIITDGTYFTIILHKISFVKWEPFHAQKWILPQLWFHFLSANWVEWISLHVFSPQKVAYKKLIWQPLFLLVRSDCLPLSPIQFATHWCIGHLNNEALAVEDTTLTADNDILAEESVNVSLGKFWPQCGVRV